LFTIPENVVVDVTLASDERSSSNNYQSTKTPLRRATLENAEESISMESSSRTPITALEDGLRFLRFIPRPGHKFAWPITLVRHIV
jgi:hypothetical protein